MYYAAKLAKVRVSTLNLSNSSQLTLLEQFL